MTNCLDFELALDRLEDPEFRVADQEGVAEFEERKTQRAAKETDLAKPIGGQALK